MAWSFPFIYGVAHDVQLSNMGSNVIGASLILLERCVVTHIIL